MNDDKTSDSQTKSGKGRITDYDPVSLWTAFDLALMRIFVAAHELLGLNSTSTQRPWFFTVDGFSHPFYGKAQRYGRKAVKRKAGEMSIAGNWASPAFRGKGKDGKPMYRGTANKHDFFQVNAHLSDGDESFPLGYRPFNPNVQSLQDFIAQMKRAPTKPYMGRLDKEFGNGKKTADLRAWMDGDGILLMVPLPKHKKLRAFIVERFNAGVPKPVKDVGRCRASKGDIVLYDVSYQTWGDDPNAFYNLLTFYYEGDPRKSDLVDATTGVLGLGNNIYAACYLVNVTVDDDNVLWLYHQIRRYWSAENVQQRENVYLGKAAGAGIFGRHLLHGAVLVQISCYALWRIERRLRLKLAGHAEGAIKRRKSHRRFFDALRLHLAGNFVPTDTPRKHF